MPLGRLGGGGGGGGGGVYMTWLLLATERSKVVAYPCHYKISILSSTALFPDLSPSPQAVMSLASGVKAWGNNLRSLGTRLAMICV